MRYLKLLLSLTLFFSFCNLLKAQNPGQGIYGNIDDATINYEHLDANGTKIKLSNGTTTTSIKYSINVSRSSNGGEWYPVNIKVGLGYKDGNNYKFFTGGHTFTGDNFQLGMATLTKELTSVIDHTLLPVGSKIYVLYENHKPNVPQSGWRIEALSFGSRVVAYDFVSGSVTPDPEGPVVGVPPAFTAPEIGSVPLYEYVSGNKRRLTTVYYSSYPGFTYNGILGYVFTSSIAGTVPLHRYTHPSNGNYYYTITLTSTSGYNYDGIACYVYANQVTKSYPVYENYSSTLGSYHRYSNTPDTFPGYRFEGVKFYILQNGLDFERQNVYEYFSAIGKDHFFTTDRSLDGNSYWAFQGTKFKALRLQAPDAVPAYSYYSSSGTDHVILIDKTPAVLDPNYWNVGGGIAFYVYTTPKPGTIPVYAFYHAADTSHMLAADQGLINYLNSTPGWRSDGIAFYAFPAN